MAETTKEDDINSWKDVSQMVKQDGPERMELNRCGQNEKTKDQVARILTWYCIGTEARSALSLQFYHTIWWKLFVWILAVPAGQHVLLFPTNVMIRDVLQEPDGNGSIHEPLYKADATKIYSSTNLKCKPACHPAKTLPCDCDRLKMIRS